MADTGFTRPTLAELVERVRADFLARLADDEVLRRSDLEVQARVQAAALHSIYGYIEYLSGQILPDTAETSWLDRHASLWGVARKAASAASGTVTFVGTAGAVIPAGTTVQRTGFGDYVTQADGVTGSPIAILAQTTGAAGNAPAGTALMMVSPIAGVVSQGVSGVLSGGADQEDDEALRARLRSRIQLPPHGGAGYDYTAWALEVPGVTQAWVYPERAGQGTVGLTFIVGGRADIVPTSDEVAAVQAHIDAVCPVTADLTVFAPIAHPINLTLSISPDTSVVRAAILAELADFFLRETEPGGTIRISRLREAISTAAGEAYHQLTAPAADVVLGAGEIGRLGTVTWA